MDLDTLINLININSYSTNQISCNQKVDFILSELKNLPLIEERVPSQKYGDMLILKSRKVDILKPNIGIILHYDTVHTPNSKGSTYIDGDKLFGDGATDMQASIFVIMEALKQLHKNERLENITVVFNSCEEKGSPEFQDKIKELAQELNYIMVFEPSENGSFDVGSEEFHKNFQLATSRKGIFQQSVSVTGPGGHSGMLAKKSERKNAISQAIAMMNAIDNLADYEKETTVNLAFVEGGKENTIIAEDCTFTFDVRYKYEAEGKRVKNTIAKILKTEYVKGVEIKDLGYNYDLPSLQPNANSKEFFELVKEVAKINDYTIEGKGRGGWSDGCNFYHYNNKLYILDGFGPKGEGEHTRQECTYIKSIKSSLDLSIKIIEYLLQ